jgi:hypothetical protein
MTRLLLIAAFSLLFLLDPALNAPRKATAIQPTAPPPSDRDSISDRCTTNPAQCGITVPISDRFGGVDNSPHCLTARIVNLPQQASDYIPVCRATDGDNAVPDSVGEDGTPSCAPFPPGRLPAAWNQTSLPSDGAVGMNPANEGLTGLDSWFWFVGTTTHRWPSPVHEGRTADCRVIPAPPPVMYTASITGFRWTIGDSRPQHASVARPGSQHAPAVTHRYRSKGRWDVAVRCTWSGSPPSTRQVDCGSRAVSVTSVRSALSD